MNPKANSILSIDLSGDWVNATVAIQSTTKPNGAPSVDGGALWYDEATPLLYTGYTGAIAVLGPNATMALPPESIWTFRPDNLGSGSWNQIISPSDPVWNTIVRTQRGYQAYGNGSAYVLGGYNINLSGHYIYPGMIEFEMSSQVFSNISSETGATSPSGHPGEYGSMHYVPSFGSNGVFVVMGGWDGNNLIDFGYVLVFDPTSGSWYNQTTTGNKPFPRYSICTAGAASSNGTYEIFVYGGDSGRPYTSSVPCDTVNILSMPAFNWFSVAYNPQNPRSGHTCEAVGGGQIAIIGGKDANPPVESEVSEDFTTLSTPDPFAQGLGIFDLGTLEFASKYQAGRGVVYEPNHVITQFYAKGSYSGNLGEGVARLMKETHFPSATSSNSTASNSTLTTPSSSSSSTSSYKNNVGAIAGSVIGGVLAIALSIALVLWVSKRQRRRLQAQLSERTAGDSTVYGDKRWTHSGDSNIRAELQQPLTIIELGYGEAHELYSTPDVHSTHELGQVRHPVGEWPELPG